MIGRTKIIISLQEGIEKHIAESVSVEDTTLGLDSNVLRTLGSGSSCEVDFADIVEAKVVMLIGNKKFQATINATEQVNSEVLLLWDTEVTSLKLEDISGEGTTVRVILSG